MNKTISLALSAALLIGLSSVSSLKADDHGLEYLDELPPLLDRDIFFGDPEIAGANVSPNGEYMTFRRPFEGVMNIWVKPIEADFDEATPLTADDRPVTSYFWSQDSRYVLYVQDKGGDENFHVYAVDPNGEVDETSGVPAARNLTDFDNVRAYLYSVPEAKPDIIYVGLNDRDPALHDVYAVTIETGERELIVENTANVAGWVFDLDGNLRMAVRQTPEGGTETLNVDDGALGAVLYECDWTETCGPLRFHPDGAQVYFQSNKGDDVDLTSLYLMDAASGALTLLESDPEGEADFAGALFSNADDELLATVYVGDRRRVYPKTEAAESMLAFLRENLPDGELYVAPQTSDDRLVRVTVTSDVNPGAVYLFDSQAMTVEKLYDSRPELPSEHLASMQPIRYQARDGLEIPAYLTLPKGAEPEGLALVALIHGGPWARDSWGYSSIVQFLANRGYAVLQPNFRASTGFGKAFLNAGNNEWGDAMQDDISDGIAHLVEQGIVDPDKVCIMGGSYGGYATLAGMTFTPELYNCGVSIVGPSNLITLLNSIPAYWGPIRKLFTLRMGNSETDEGRAQMERQSPLNSVDNIESPLLVIQGANDPRVKQAESDQIVIAMREKALPVEYIVAPDEGHGFRGRENRMAMFARIEAFLADHNGGRYQTDMPNDIAERLAAITVDISEVEAPFIATELDVARINPLPPVDAELIHVGPRQFEATINMGGQEIPISGTREIVKTEVDGQTHFRVTTTSRSAMGSGTDVYYLDAVSLLPVKRSINQGPASIETEYSSTGVTGQINAQGQTFPVELELPAPSFGADGALLTAILGMPLDTGFSDTVRAIEVGMQNRLRLFSVSVEGVEDVSVPAGDYTTWRVRIEPIDGEGGGQTLWITQDTPRISVKSETNLPAAMGGATVVSVLSSLESPEA
ncbi:MAG: S9 family peptidase [Pseudomonadota bacterium]